MPRPMLDFDRRRIRWTPLVLLMAIAALIVGACATSPDELPKARSAQPGEADAAPKPQTHSTPSGAAAAESRVVAPRVLQPAVDLKPALQAASKTLDAALMSSGKRVSGWWEPLRQQPDFHALLDPERSLNATLSMGSVGTGELLNARELKLDGAHHSVIERHRHRHTQYATGAMIELLVDVAGAVDTAIPGPKLRIGNMSLRDGGDMRWSRSHNSGRDADLAFYCKNLESGESVLAPDLLRFDATGRGVKRPDLVFDTPRNWELVKALLTHPKVDIQWLFISNPLKRILLHYAQDQGADAELIARAAQVLHQPTDARPHSDHLHLRITCPEQDRLEGCLDYGPRWEWVDWHDDALRARSLALAGAFASPDESTRLRALNFLERIRSPYAPVLSLSLARRDPSDQVRQRALEVATNIPAKSGAAVVEALKFIAQPEFSLHEKAYAYRLLRRSVDPYAVEPLQKIIRNAKASPAEQRLAADALIHYMDPALIPFLLAQLETQPASVCEKLAISLRRITNRSENVDWSLLAMQEDPKSRDLALRAWHQWWEKNQSTPRQEWLLEGFSAQGMTATPGQALDKNAVDTLIELLGSAPDHIAYNANLELKRITGRWAPLEAWDNERLHKYWGRYWKWWRENNLEDLVASR